MRHSESCITHSSSSGWWDIYISKIINISSIKRFSNNYWIIDRELFIIDAVELVITRRNQ